MYSRWFQVKEKGTFVLLPSTPSFYSPIERVQVKEKVSEEAGPKREL